MGVGKKPEEVKGSEPTPQVTTSSAPTKSSDYWILEDKYPSIDALLAPSKKIYASDKDVAVVLDTNALLLPFRLGKQGLSEIKEAYEHLISEKRLFVPARVIREYIDNRDRRLAELVKNFRDQTSRSNQADVDIAPLLRELTETEKFRLASEDFRKARKAYVDASQAVVSRILEWRGDDPVTTVYGGLFVGDVILDASEDQQAIEKEWSKRLSRKIPPGYKDGAKPDAGIGDFIIWRVILQIAQDQKKDLIFVTGEEKADWWVRSDGEGVYPRPELVDEYRRMSGGRHLRLSKLADILAELKAPEKVVIEVRRAEVAANTAAQISKVIELASATTETEIVVNPRSYWISRAVFNYSENEGMCIVEKLGAHFELKFSEADGGSIYLHQTPQTLVVANISHVSSGARVPDEVLYRAHESQKLGVGERFLVTTVHGAALTGHINRIEYDPQDPSRNRVDFSYRTFLPGQNVIAV